MPSANDSIDELVNIEPIKVWSLLVTMLGDLGASEPSSIPGKQIDELLSHIGIKSNAIRVALHRLKKEGWIETSKASNDGREVMYGLSVKGLKETEAVYEDVYRTSVKYDSGWLLQVRHGDIVPNETTALRVFKHVAVVPVELCSAVNNPMHLAIDRSAVPEWFLHRVFSPQAEVVAEQILVVLSKLDELIERASALDRAAIRLLMLHLWRRLALRDSTWFHIWLYPDGALSRCHQQVTLRLESM